MEDETELTRQKMTETRTALSEKVESLQERVLSAVEGTTKSVTDTVQSVQEAVQDTVSSVSGSVQSTVDTVKRTFDIGEHVQRHPWLMLGGAVAVGYIAGRLLDGFLSGPATGAPAVSGNGVPVSSGHPAPAAPLAAARAPAPPSGPSWLETLAGPLTKQLQGVAVGALTGLATEMILEHAPENLKGPLTGLSETVNKALGGTPVQELWGGLGGDKK